MPDCVSAHLNLPGKLSVFCEFSVVFGMVGAGWCYRVATEYYQIFSNSAGIRTKNPNVEDLLNTLY